MRTEFEITTDHLKLLKRMHVTWENGEFGAPAINCKRLYGNSDVEGDIAEILNLTTFNRYSDDEPYYEPETIKYINAIHKEMQTVIQIGCATGAFELGKYTKTDEYDSTSWVKIKE